MSRLSKILGKRSFCKVNSDHGYCNECPWVGPLCLHIDEVRMYTPFHIKDLELFREQTNHP